MRTLNDIFENGKRRGTSIAMNFDLPAFVVGDPSQEAAYEAAQTECDEIEGHDRDFSPFEFRAKELNDHPESEAAWESFNRGIGCGIAEELTKRIYG